MLYALYHSNKRLHLKYTTKYTIKTMDISSLLNTDLGHLSDSSLILKNNRLFMYNTMNTINIFLKFPYSIGKKIKTYFLTKTKAFFQNQRFG